MRLENGKLLTYTGLEVYSIQLVSNQSITPIIQHGQQPDIYLGIQQHPKTTAKCKQLTYEQQITLLLRD